MKKINEMTMDELRMFVDFVSKQTKILNETLGLRGSKKYNINVFDGCESEVQVENRKHSLMMAS